MEKYTYTFIDNTNTDKTTFLFSENNTSTDYSKILDNIILSDVINQNSFLKKKDDSCIKTIFKKKSKPTISIFDALDILKNTKKNKKIKIDFGTKYELDGIPVIFYDDEIQIGFDIYSYDDLDDILFINNLTPKAKEDIIKISIKINI